MQSRVITISIRKYLVKQPRTKRARKASRYFRERIAHYTKTDPDNVKIDRELNSLIIKHYSRRMVPIKASVSIENGIAKVYSYGSNQNQKVQPPTKGKPVNVKPPQTAEQGKQQKKEPVSSSVKVEKTAVKDKRDEGQARQGGKPAADKPNTMANQQS